jgi:hypothetical protein
MCESFLVYGGIVHMKDNMMEISEKVQMLVVGIAIGIQLGVWTMIIAYSMAL